MDITEKSADWIKFILHRIATKGCTGIKCRKCILKYRCLTRKPEGSSLVALLTSNKFHNKCKKNCFF